MLRRPGRPAPARPFPAPDFACFEASTSRSRRPGPHRRLTGIASAWEGRLVETDYLGSADGPAWLVDRAAFDDGLAEAAAAAGVRFIEGRAAAEREEGALAAGRTSAAGFLVDATGRSAALARRLGARTRIEHDLVALWSVAEGEAPLRLDRPLVERAGEGWWYSVRLDERRTYAALHVPARGAARAAEGWTERLLSTRFLAPLLAAAGRFPPPLGSPAGGARLDPVRGDGWAACGDAALAFDPLSSQGLLGAMAGGHMLAEALLAEDRESALLHYEARLEEIWRLYRDRRDAFYG